MKNEVYILSQIACALIEAMGLIAENQHCQIRSIPYVPYGEGAFNQIIEKYGIHHNQVLSVLHKSDI